MLKFEPRLLGKNLLLRMHGRSLLDGYPTHKRQGATLAIKWHIYLRQGRYSWNFAFGRSTMTRSGCMEQDNGV